MSEKVNHPPHYGGDTTYEVIKVLEAWKLGFHLGNTVKYIARAGKKPDTDVVDDLNKALWYLQRKIGLLSADGSDTQEPKTLPQRIQEAAHQLNTLLGEAAQEGLQLSVGAVDVSLVGDHTRRYIINIS